MSAKKMKILSCSSNEPLAQDIAKYIGIDLVERNITQFSDGEYFIEILENVRGEDIFAVQSTSSPSNQHLMELLITIDALRRGSAKRITAVIPYYGYARQDRKTGPRTPITAKLVANLLTTAGADRVLTLDLHAGQIQGFFDIPLDNLHAGHPIFVPAVQERLDPKGGPLMIVSPDVGGVVRARAMAKKMDANLAIIDKRREKAGISEVMHVIGDVQGCQCVLVDDIVDSAGTLCNAARALMEKGASSVTAVSTHGVLSGEAISRIEKSPMRELLITDSICATDGLKSSTKIKQLSVAPLLGEAILRITEDRSVSSLFDMVLPRRA